MNEKEIEREERYYERFRQENAQPLNRDEIRAFSLYARVRHQIRNAKVPRYDKKNLIDRMTGKMNEDRGRFQWLFMGSSRFKLLTAAVYAGVFLVCFTLCAQTILSIDWGLAKSIQFKTGTDTEVPVSLFWKYKLLSGKKVNIPMGIQAVLTLSDGSTVECGGQSQISVEFDVRRTICLSLGKITVRAGKHPDWPMEVATPVGKVQVTGTVFTVELTNN